MHALAIPAALCERVAAEARSAAPRECCGLIEGVRNGGALRVTALHPVANLAREPDRFEIDPREQFRLLREGRTIIGCYHSHPNGPAEPSPRDAEYAFEGEFVWLIAGAEGALAAFTWDGARFVPLPLTQTGCAA
jgi:proteasome lid subunit RPN8/RPN11